MTQRLGNKTALITGSTSNIGRAIAMAFAAEGAHVIVSGRDSGRGDAVVTSLREAGGKADFVRADLDGTAAASGVIINLGSWIARLGIPVGALYSSTKGAVETLTRAWSAEFGPRGVRVNAVSPGVIRSPDLDPDAEYPGEVMMRGTPANRSGHPDAIAAAAVYLASDEAAFVHGTVIDVDGGRVGVAVLADAG